MEKQKLELMSMEELSRIIRTVPAGILREGAARELAKRENTVFQVKVIRNLTSFDYLR